MREKVFYQLWVLELIKKVSFRKALKQEDLYFGQEQILRHIKNNPGCKQIEIASFLRCTPASIATSTKRLEKAGFLEKKYKEDSLREKSLFLTEKGLKATENIKRALVELDEKTLNGITLEEKDELERILNKLIINCSGKDVSEIDIHDYLDQLQEENEHGKKQSK